MTILTGVKPTGTLHLGNYIGAIAPLLDLMRDTDDSVFALVADLHALNYEQDPASLGPQSIACAAALMAFDVDERLILYRSSRVPEIGQIMGVISNFTAKGYLNRAHAYKAARAANEEAERPADANINAGLYVYPLLMAADIYAIRATSVPVGTDQLQHLEIAQEIARSFNKRYGTALAYPQAISQRGHLMPGLDGRKMSKSYDNIVPLFGPERSRAIHHIVTTPRTVEEPADPDTCHLVALHRLFAHPDEVADLESLYRRGGFGYGAVKDLLIAAVDRRLAAADARYAELMANPDLVRSRLEAGEAQARARAGERLSRLLDTLGI